MMDEQSSYGRLKERLEEIVVQVRSKEVPLEKSLDLYDEALRIGGRCVEKLEMTDFTADEMAAASDASEAAVAVPADIGTAKTPATESGETFVPESAETP
jgi:exodeoxyribonuclease VII small subunit